ncbi:MAG: outer rane efflux protein [Gemmatimonadetes bacterium]|nr:outer rane efflux protein [Gemmatimonadota bacterium]
MRTLVFALAVAAIAPVLGAQSGPASSATLTLDEAVSLARRNNPVYLSQASARRTADASVRSARGALLPSADASFTSRYQQAGQQVFSGQSFSNSSATLQSSYSLGLNYRVNKSTFLTPRAAEANRDAVEADITGSAELLRSTVTQQYLSVLQAQARSALQDTLVKTAQGQLDLAKAKVAVGSGTSLDIRRAEVALGQSQVALLRERNNVEIEKLRLFQQMGVAQPDNVSLVTDFPITAPNFNLATLLDDARRGNPAIVALRARDRSADLNVQVAKSAYTPTLTLSTGVGGNSYQYTNADYLIGQAQAQIAGAQASCFQVDSLRTRVGLSSSNCNSSAYQFTSAQADAIRAKNSQFPFSFQRSPLALNATLSIPIFDNFGREERVQQAQVNKEDALYNVKAKDLALTADVTQAYRTLTTAAQTVTLQEQNASKAKEELSFAEERYKVGASTFLDVVTSRGSYEQALIDRVNAVYDYHKAFAALENAVGHPLR